MDSEEDELSFLESGGAKGKQAVAARPSTRREEAGLLSELHSPLHSFPANEQIRSGFASGDDVGRVSPFVQERSAGHYGLRPMTAMSQAGADAIPNLEDVRQAGEAPEAVKAPFLAMNNLFSYQELERDLMKNAAFTTFDDLDFSPLFSRLLPESEVQVEDENWTWDKLVASVSAALPPIKSVQQTLSGTEASLRASLRR